MLVVGVVILVVVCLVRVFTLHDRSAQLWSLGLCAIALAFVLRIPNVDRSIDQNLAVANVSDLGHVLLAGVAWCVLGVASLRAIRRRRRLWESAVSLWVLANVVAGLAAATLWWTGDGSQIEVEDTMSLDDGGTRALIWLYLVWPLAGGLLVMAAAVLGMRDPTASRLEVRAMRVMVGVGICGVGYALTAAVLLVAGGGDVLERHSAQIMLVWGMPGLLLLAAGGVVGVLADTHRRHCT